METTPKGHTHCICSSTQKQSSRMNTLPTSSQGRPKTTLSKSCAASGSQGITSTATTTAPSSRERTYRKSRPAPLTTFSTSDRPDPPRCCAWEAVEHCHQSRVTSRNDNPFSTLRHSQYPVFSHENRVSNHHHITTPLSHCITPGKPQKPPK